MGKLEKPVIIGIAGGSGSGKTTIAHEIADNINDTDHDDQLRSPWRFWYASTWSTT